MKTKMTTMKTQGTKMMKMTGRTIIIIPVPVVAVAEMEDQEGALAV